MDTKTNTDANINPKTNPNIHIHIHIEAGRPIASCTLVQPMGPFSATTLTYLLAVLEGGCVCSGSCFRSAGS